MEATASTCPSCHAATEPDMAFCASCGTALTVKPAAAAVTPEAAIESSQPVAAIAAAEPRQQQTFGEFLAQIGGERTGVAGLIAVIVVCSLLSLVLWEPFAQPAKWIRDALPDSTCVGKPIKSTEMYICSAKIGFYQALGPIVLTILVFLFRMPIKAWIDKVSVNLPLEARFLFAPVVATAAFTLSWAGFHSETASLTGILPQRIFPVVVGVFTYSVARWGSDLQRLFAGFFEFRDGFAKPVRFAVLILVPILLSYLITNQDRVTQTATKEQVVVIVALSLGFLMLAPRTGDAMAGMSEQVGIKGTAT